ncbi:MAG: DNA polymerase III subunit chi [Betaproteobacteria bacterium]|nr:DNA polymerase III subunit chi [Betaproteobacteria bacterium]
MTRIDFYTRAPNKLRTACSLCHKAVSRGMRVAVLTPDAATTEAVGRELWSVPPTGFLPHVRARHRLAGVTPVIVDHDLAELDRDEVLVNLRLDTPDVFSRFHRLVEIVSLDEEDLVAGRLRYRFYRDRGYDIHSHDLSRSPT